VQLSRGGWAAKKALCILLYAMAKKFIGPRHRARLGIDVLELVCRHRAPRVMDAYSSTCIYRLLKSSADR
jgi:hypothetical protein